MSRLSVPAQHARSRHKAQNRARSLSKPHTNDPELVSSATSSVETRASSHSRHYRVQRSELGKGIIYLPKEFNPASSIQALESLDNFRTKCFFSKSEEANKDNITSVNFYPLQQEVKKTNFKSDANPDENSFTNHIFLASYEQNYLKRFTQDSHLENTMKERKSRTFNTRYTTEAAVYKQFVTESRKKDMIVIGCLIVEIFLHTHMRPLRSSSNSFVDRYNSCRTVLKYNIHNLPKCVTYIASLLLNIDQPTLNLRAELPLKTAKDSDVARKVITEKGLPFPTPSQLLQPFLMQHLIPFPQTFGVLYSLLMTLHEYQLTSNELNVLYMYECDGVECDKYQNVDKTKLYFTQRVAEGKIQACVAHLDTLLTQLTCFNQFDILDIFLSHYVELLENRDTSVLAAWYLFDTVSKALGPTETRKKILKHILNLYEDDEVAVYKLDQSLINDKEAANTSTGSLPNRQKFVKLYHNIFLLQLMVRLGLRCFLDNFTQHLVEAVGGYKDAGNVGSPGHLCRDRALVNKKPRYSDDTVKNALTTNSDIFSPDTSYGSEQIATPVIEKSTVDSEGSKDTDNRSESDLFHFESEKDSRQPSRCSRSKSPTESLDSYTLSVHHENAILTPSPTTEVLSPQSNKECAQPLSPRLPTSPTIDIPKSSMFTSYLHFAEDDDKLSNEDVEYRKSEHVRRTSKSLDLNSSASKALPSTSKACVDEEVVIEETYKISDMSCESLLWLSHRLGPVLTCRYITRNLLKMLTLCYIGKENLVPLDNNTDGDEFDSISIANSRVVGDRNAMKVIKCLTSIVSEYLYCHKCHNPYLAA